MKNFLVGLAVFFGYFLVGHSQSQFVQVGTSGAEEIFRTLDVGVSFSLFAQEHEQPGNYDQRGLLFPRLQTNDRFQLQVSFTGVSSGISQMDVGFVNGNRAFLRNNVVSSGIFHSPVPDFLLIHLLAPTEQAAKVGLFSTSSSRWLDSVNHQWVMVRSTGGTPINNVDLDVYFSARDWTIPGQVGIEVFGFNGNPDIVPEPTGLGIVTFAGVLVLLRRRRV